LHTARSRSRCYAARPSARERGVDGSDFAVLTRTSCGRNIKMPQRLGELAKLKTKSRTPLTSRPVGSISRSHRDPSLRADLGSMALRARVAAYSRMGGLQRPRPRQRDGVRRLGHLEDAERPLH
jgi:hypothetical protein